jgi:soluble lytic murein transglycosylase-like protein
MKTLFLLMILLFPLLAGAACFDEAAQRYRIHPDLLKAISKVESNGNPRAVNRSNKNGSRDIGHMQINSSWLRKLGKYGISEQSLFDPCINTFVGAWVLANNFRELGYNWTAIGAYNTKSPDKRIIYARKVETALNRIRNQQ